MIEFVAWPEMLAWPYLILSGWLPYRDIAIVHTPLLLVILTGWYKIFGIGIVQLKLFTLSLAILTSVLLYVISKSKKVIAIYLLLWLSFGGYGLWFDLALAPLGLILYIFTSTNNSRLSGIVFAVILFTKQTGIWFGIPALISRKVNHKSFLKAFLLIISGGVSILYITGLFSDFMKWAVHFGIFILPKSIGQIQFPTKNQLFITFLLLLIFASKKSNLKFLPWVIAGFMGSYPRWEWFHLQPGIPFLALGFSKSKTQSILVMLLCLFMISKFNPGSTTRFIDSQFLTIVDSVKKNVNPGEKLFILNTWDHLFTYTNTLPATKPLVPHLPWYMEQKGIQESIINQLEIDPPRWVLIRSYDRTGLGSYIPIKLNNYIEKKFLLFEQVGEYKIYTFNK